MVSSTHEVGTVLAVGQAHERVLINAFNMKSMSANLYLADLTERSLQKITLEELVSYPLLTISTQNSTGRFVLMGVDGKKKGTFCLYDPITQQQESGHLNTFQNWSSTNFLLYCSNRDDNIVIGHRSSKGIFRISSVDFEGQKLTTVYEDPNPNRPSTKIDFFFNQIRYSYDRKTGWLGDEEGKTISPPYPQDLLDQINKNSKRKADIITSFYILDSTCVLNQYHHVFDDNGKHHRSRQVCTIRGQHYQIEKNLNIVGGKNRLIVDVNKDTLWFETILP